MSSAADSDYNASSKIVVEPKYVDNKEVSGGETPYQMPRQTGTGNTRGTQNVSGKIVIIDPASGVARMVMGYEKDGF